MSSVLTTLGQVDPNIRFLKALATCSYGNGPNGGYAVGLDDVMVVRLG